MNNHHDADSLTGCAVRTADITKTAAPAFTTDAGADDKPQSVTCKYTVCPVTTGYPSYTGSSFFYREPRYVS
ncbi:hypothetical protein UA45_13715 [Morganella morganii]|uniref:Uncharacterized protein n=1 Tax=Morganella morganii TaxID=582 RepID=A0A0D8L822_MORMO|nr:hypothetical protein UA45_13715 [Morganella morganii]